MTPAAPSSKSVVTETPAIKVSVVIVRFAGGDALATMLPAVRRELNGRIDAEILVADEEPGNPAEGTRLIVLPRGSGPSRLRAAAVAAAKGKVVIVTEDHCIPRPGWLRAIEEGHEAGHPVIGGPITPAEGLGGIDLAASLLAYGRYGTVAEGPSPSLSDCNVSYERSVLDATESVWREAFVESDLHAALSVRGIGLWMAAGAGVTQARRVDLATAVQEQRVHGEEYAAGRAQRMTAGRRRLMRHATVLLPVLLTVRTAASRGTVPWRRVLGALPGVLRLAAAWAQGERRGYAQPRTR